MTSTYEERNSTRELGKILFMDDEEIIRSFGRDILGYLGYFVETASDGEEAVSLFTEKKKIGQPFDAVILDIHIPGGVGGESTIKRLLDIDPDIKAVVSSGDRQSDLMTNFRKYGFRAALPKPYSTGELREILKAVFPSNKCGSMH